MKKKISFIFQYKFTNGHYQNYEIKHLSKFYQITIYDLNNMYFPYLKKKTIRKEKGIKLFIINNNLELEKIIKKNPANYTFLDCSPAIASHIALLLRRLTKTKIVELKTGILPFSVNEYRKKARNKIILTKLFFFFPFILRSIFRKIMSQVKKITMKQYIVDYLFYSGSDTLRALPMQNKNYIKKISIPSFDYNKFLKEKKFKSIVKKKYIVFVDMQLFHHDDHNIIFEEKPVTLKYFKEMNNFFTKLEKVFKLKVVIALHPSCSVKNYSSFFQNRRCFKNKTNQLIKFAEIVLTHPFTTALSFPVIYKKPIIFLTTEEINESFSYNKQSEALNSFYKIDVKNISEKKELPTTTKINVNKEFSKKYYKAFVNSTRNSKNLVEHMRKHLK
jgi:hypothetical protein